MRTSTWRLYVCMCCLVCTKLVSTTYPRRTCVLVQVWIRAPGSQLEPVALSFLSVYASKRRQVVDHTRSGLHDKIRRSYDRVNWWYLHGRSLRWSPTRCYRALPTRCMCRYISYVRVYEFIRHSPLVPHWWWYSYKYWWWCIIVVSSWRSICVVVWYPRPGSKKSKKMCYRALRTSICMCRYTSIYMST